jgi:thiol-disulfide isomerase/thioredoxin
MKKLIIAAIALAASLSAFSQTETKPGLTLAEVVAKINSNSKSQILDARSAEEFAQNHLKGAINVDLKSPDYQAIIAKLDKSQPTFTYAIGGGRSGQLAAQLRTNNFVEVYVIPGGIANWIGLGNPIVNNTKTGIAISPENYQELRNSDQLVLVDFGSKYCPGCRRLKPVLDSLESAKVSRLKIVRIETYDNPDLARQLGINSWPTLVLYKNGKEVWKNTGFIEFSALQSVIEAKGLLAAK